MKTLLRHSLCLIIAGLMSACAANLTKPTASNKSANTKTCIMQSNGTDILTLAIPSDLHIKSATDGSLDLDGPKYEVEFWLVPNAHTLDDAAAQISPTILSQFKNFKTKTTTTLTIADSPAKHLIGTGNEADDGDPGEADLILFQVGHHFFIACTHGEELSPAGQLGLLTITQTAQKP